jgi:hypothetical protein
MAWKLMDLQNFAVYFDDELLGCLEGQKFVVRTSRERVEGGRGQGEGRGLDRGRG